MADYEERYKVEPQCNPDFPAYVYPTGYNDALCSGNYYIDYRPTERKEPSATHPPHYSKLSIEPIDVIESWDLPYSLGCVLKYIARYRNKNGIEDLQKAQWYLNRYIEQYETDKS